MHRLFSAGALALAAATPVWSASGTTICTRETAMEARDITQLCSCKGVTSGLLDTLRGANNFDRILVSLDSSCPRLALLLTDVATGAIRPAVLSMVPHRPVLQVPAAPRLTALLRLPPEALEPVRPVLAPERPVVVPERPAAARVRPEEDPVMATAPMPATPTTAAATVPKGRAPARAVARTTTKADRSRATGCVSRPSPELRAIA